MPGAAKGSGGTGPRAFMKPQRRHFSAMVSMPPGTDFGRSTQVRIHAAMLTGGNGGRARRAGRRDGGAGRRGAARGGARRRLAASGGVGAVGGVEGVELGEVGVAQREVEDLCVLDDALTVR